MNTFAPNFDARLKDILQRALREQIYVRILLLNPFCKEVHDRQFTLQKWDGQIEGTINQNINFLQEIYNEAQEQKIDSKRLLHLKLYNSWAPFSLYATDRGASIGFFMNGTLAVEGPQLVITKDEHCFDKFIDQFEKIWETGKLFKLSEKDWQAVLDRDFKIG